MSKTKKKTSSRAPRRPAGPGVTRVPPPKKSRKKAMEAITTLSEATEPLRGPEETPTETEETPKKKLSLLDAAIVVLGNASEPLSVKQIFEAIIEQKLWEPGAGKTPMATLSAGMQTEIIKKGSASRFAKPAPGRFTLAG